MIKSFADAEAEKVYDRQVSHRLPSEIQPTVLRLLRMLNNSASLDDLRLIAQPDPAHPGRYDMRVNAQWRVCFEWRDGDVWNVGIAPVSQESQ